MVEVIFLLLLVTCMATAQNVSLQNPVRFLALGDSYTIGQSVPEEDRWPVQLADELTRWGFTVDELDIIAITGWTTDNLLDAISTTPSSYNLVSLLIGVNNQFQQRDIAVYRTEFRQLLEKAIVLCNNRKEGVFVLSIPDYGYTPFGESNQQQISREIDEYNKINKEITDEMGIAYFNITPISREAVNRPEYLAADLLHPSGAMYAAWVKLIVASGQFNLTPTHTWELSQNNMPVVYPNPANDFIKINWQQNFERLHIVSSLGTEVYATSVANKNSLIINTQKWPPGLYVYRFKNSNTSFVKGRFVISY